MIRRVAPGVVLLGRFRPCNCGSWLLHHGREAAVVELPPSSARRNPPWVLARRVLRGLGASLKALLASHAHWDHLGGYPSWRWAFPHVPLVVHRSFRDAWELGPHAVTFDDDVLELDLDGEPLLLVHAPKHSPQDTLVVFRGTVCTGDWTLGRVPDCNRLVSLEDKVRALDGARRLLQERRYQVHTTYSAHANDLRRGVDFGAMLSRMQTFWTRRLQRAAGGR